jgi:hypothetical protein
MFSSVPSVGYETDSTSDTGVGLQWSAESKTIEARKSHDGTVGEVFWVPVHPTIPKPTYPTFAGDVVRLAPDSFPRFSLSGKISSCQLRQGSSAAHADYIHKDIDSNLCHALLRTSWKPPGAPSAQHVSRHCQSQDGRGLADGIRATTR